MERKKDNLSLKEALKDFVSTHNLQKGMDKIDTARAWSSLMGPGVNKYTRSVELKGDILYVSLTSSVLREELSHGKSKIITMLNEELGKELISKLILR